MTDYFTAEQVYQSLKEENAALQKVCHEQQAELETLRAKLKTNEDLGDAGSDMQLLRMGYAAARLEIESLQLQLTDQGRVLEKVMHELVQTHRSTKGEPTTAYAAKHYAKRDHQAQGAYYVNHVSAMTGEGLHAKSAIAAELAHRDMEIDRLRAALAAPAQPVAQQGMAYAALPEPALSDDLYCADMMRAFADATHALRVESRVESLAAAYCEELDKLSQRNYELRLASHGQAPAQPEGVPECHYGPLRDADAEWGKQLSVYATLPRAADTQQAPAGESLRTDALCDLSYSHGLKAGWNYCASDDLAGFERAQKIGTEALRTLKSTTAQAAPAAVAGLSRDLHPEKCPVTGRPFFMTLDHPELGDVPTYGGPYDSYTIPAPEGEPTDPWHERELRSERYDHDAGWWVEGGEPIPLRIVHEDVLFKLQEDAEAAAPTTQPSPQQEAQGHEGYKQATGSSNCMQCCVGYMLGLPIEKVPHFANGGGWDQFIDFAKSQGHAAVMLPGAQALEADYLASGKTNRGTSHMVVMNDGKLVFDPHPSNAGLSTVQCVWVLAKLAGTSQKPIGWLYDWMSDGGEVRDWFSQDYDEAYSPTNQCHNIRPLYTAPQPSPTAQAAPAYKDSTPELHIGDSAFESWYNSYSPAHKSDKQRARDAYAAGMGDPLVTAAPAKADEPEPQPSPAVQGDALDAACQRACMELPEGMSMAIQLERDAGWIELHDSDGEQIELPNADGSLAEQVHQAIDAARAAQGGM